MLAGSTLYVHVLDSGGGRSRFRGPIKKAKVSGFGSTVQARSVAGFGSRRRKAKFGMYRERETKGMGGGWGGSEMDIYGKAKAKDELAVPQMLLNP